MKLLKTLSILSLSALVAVSAQAKTETKKAQPAQATKAEEVSALKRFSDSVGLRFMGIDAKENNNQVMVNFRYVLENKSKNIIKSVHWATIYTHNNQPVLVQDVPISFEPGLKPQESTPLVFSVNWASLPAAAQKALTDSKAAFSAQFQAKSIEFINGSKN